MPRKDVFVNRTGKPAKPGRRSRGFAVRDPGEVSRLVQALVDSAGGTQTAAAARFGLSQPTFSRLLNGRPLSNATAARLEELIGKILGPGEAAAFAGAVTSPEVIRLLRASHAWCLERQDRLINRRGTYWVPQPGKGARPLRGSATIYRLSSRRGLHRAVSAYPDVEEFHKFCLARGVSGQRELLAHIRVLEPLLEDHESAFIERGWKELTKQAELPRFLRAGYERERILLDREHEVERARKLVTSR
jgi:transcriptional regulator with XRE-family HTH domain